MQHQPIKTVKQADTVDLYIKERSDGEPAPEGAFRFCTLTKRSNQRTIQFRLPDDIQQKILSAYQQGKVVRVFSA